MSDPNLARRTKVVVHFIGANIVKTLENGQGSFVYTDNEEGETDGLQFSFADKTGVWMARLLGNLFTSAAAESPHNYTVRATGGLNVRAEASGSARKLGSLPFGRHVYALEVKDGWAAINFNNQKAYVGVDKNYW